MNYTIPIVVMAVALLLAKLNWNKINKRYNKKQNDVEAIDDFPVDSIKTSFKLSEVKLLQQKERYEVAIKSLCSTRTSYTFLISKDNFDFVASTIIAATKKELFIFCTDDWEQELPVCRTAINNYFGKLHNIVKLRLPNSRFEGTKFMVIGDRSMFCLSKDDGNMLANFSYPELIMTVLKAQKDASFKCIQGQELSLNLLEEPKA